LTGVAARLKLRGLRESNPEFWEELINVSPPDDEVSQPEDQDKPPPDSGIDDVDVPIQALVESMVKKRVSKGYVVIPDGGMEADTVVEAFNDAVVSEDTSVTLELGRGKRRKKPNTLYTSFWRHNDNDSKSDE
jgi:hypothetical protein